VANEVGATVTIYPVIGLATWPGFAVQTRLITPEAPRSAEDTFGAPGRGYDVSFIESL
jgi:hypothetical protein